LLSLRLFRLLNATRNVKIEHLESVAEKICTERNTPAGRPNVCAQT